jgi:eukaryotic-like serine/threonine-protein kinase
MTLTTGTRLGIYEITAQLGAGGMGAVYRARDTKLNRDVALKVLLPEVANDSDRLARFRREAQVLASLNHPHIGGIYGLEVSAPSTGSGQATTIALVMELVEGDDLSERIARGPLPLDDALAIATQIAEALEAAHEQGIIHRDLKPANIKVRDDGTVKVLDFGLAKALDAGAGGAGRAGGPGRDDLSASPTLTSPAMMTGVGVILGTAAYMAPEQARGRAVDKRADIWAFGVVLFEMLTGTRAFPGEDVTDTIVCVMSKEPDFAALPATVPARVTQALRLCLRKDAKQRVGDMRDVRLALEGAFETAAPQTSGTPSASARSGRMAWMAALAVASVVAIALAVPAVRHLRETPASRAPLVHLTMGVAPAQRLGPTQNQERASRTAFAIDPAGTTIVFAGEVESNGTRTTMLYRRPLAAAEPTAMPGTEGAIYPFFSPDGQWVGFGTSNKLKKVATAGGPPLDICDFPSSGTSRFSYEGASWASSGLIVFANRGLWTVSSGGGTPEVLIAFDMNVRMLSPALLPGGDATVLFTAAPAGSRWEDARVDAVSVSTKARKTLLTGAADARYIATGHLAFMRDATLLAVPFDAARVEVTGTAVPLLAGVMQSTNAPNSNDETGMGQYALSASGTLVYAAGGRYPNSASHLVRVSRKGEQTRIADTADDVIGIRVVPPGSRIVAYRMGDGSRAADVWLFDLAAGIPSRLTSSGTTTWPAVAPDGKSIIVREATRSFIVSLAGGGAPEPLADGVIPASVSRDGKWFTFLRVLNGVYQIFVAPARDGRPDTSAARPFSASPFTQESAVFSPDGRWIAYTSNESGATEVYAAPFPGPGEKHRLSSAGGLNPAWSADGRELFFLERRTVDSVAMKAIDVSTAGAFVAGAPRTLFEGAFSDTVPLRSYDVAPDGTFIMNRPELPPAQPVSTLHVVIGWAGDLTTRVPAGK